MQIQKISIPGLGFKNKNKQQVSFKSFSSYINQKDPKSSVSDEFYKQIKDMAKVYDEDDSLDVLVFRDGKVVCGQIELSDDLKYKHDLDCDSCFAYENHTGDGKKLAAELAKNSAKMHEKYKEYIA